MKVSLKWLNQYVDIHDLDPNDIAQKLTFAGIEVEEIRYLAQCSGLCIGQVIECVNHPDSDHLHITKVDLGDKYGVVQIVCGAPNVRVGLKVICARVGAVLPNITIVKSTIRGVESCGMLCSLTELGVDSKYLTQAQIDGIEELNPDAIVGNEDVLGYLGLDDTILDLKLLANRSDCLAMKNVAYEIGALYEREVKIPTAKEDTDNIIDINVDSKTELCPQIGIKIIKGVKVEQSPKWMQDILRSMGIRSINNIVDIGNYVMLMTGQPVHMYDLDKLPKNELIVRDDVEGEWVALDEATYQIQKGDLVITSDGKIMCLGGVMGALECAVDENTTNLAIESATFDSKTIRHTSTRLNLISESSMRFVKGINKNQTGYVLNTIASLMKEYANAKEEGKIVNYDTLKHEQVVIDASISRINNRLGTSFHDEIISSLKRVGIVVEMIDDDNFKAYIPAHRIDISLEADLSEEVIRLLGFEHVNSVLPELETTVGSMTLIQKQKRNIREYLINHGFLETLNYSLVNAKEIELFSAFNKGDHYSLLHPMTEDHTYVRSVILPSLLDTIKYNVARGTKDLAMFELSDVYTKEKRSSHLAIVLCGEKANRGLMNKENYTFYHMKGIFEGIMDLLGLEPVRYRLEVLGNDISELHPGRSAQVLIGKERVCVFGELHPKILKEFDLGKGPVIVLELKLDSLLNLRTSQIKMKAPSKYPTVEHDLALIAKKDIPASDIIRLIKQSGHTKVKSVEVFDVYEGEHIQAGYKSLAVKLTYSDDNKAFTSEEIASIEQEIIATLNKKLNVTLRS